MTQKQTASAAEHLVAAAVSGESLALSRLITALENDLPTAPALIAALQPHLKGCLVVGFTGPPGAGKSTLVGAYITTLRAQGKTVGVIAVDPSSPISGGSILGDRLRMSAHGTDEGVFIRSLASRGHLGGLSPTANRVVEALDAAGKDVIILETVGTGQSEIEVAEVADVKVVVAAPGLGDEIQAIKAGILEIADILVVNKADQPLAKQTIGQLKAMLRLRRNPGRSPVQVIATVATAGSGLDDLAEAIADRAGQGDDETRKQRREIRTRRLILDEAKALVSRTAASSGDQALQELCNAVQSGDVTLEQAAKDLLALVTKAP